MKHIEETIAVQLATWLQTHHKNIIYRFDLAADMKMTIGQAAKNKRLNKLPKYPDFFMAEPTAKYSGLFIELKKAKSEVFKQDGNYKKSNHVHGQRIILEILEHKGYLAVFAFSLEDAKEIITNYLKGNTDERHQRNYQ